MLNFSIFAISMRLFGPLPSSHHNKITSPSFKWSPLPCLKFSCPYHFPSLWRNFHFFPFLSPFLYPYLAPIAAKFHYHIFLHQKYLLSNFQVSSPSGGSLALPQSQWSVAVQILKIFLSPAIFDVFSIFYHHGHSKYNIRVHILIVLDDALLLNIVSISYD